MIFYTTGQSTYLYWCSTTKPLSCTLPWVCVHVCVKQTRQFRLWWLAHSDPAPAPRGYPSVPLSRCGKAKCWMGYPVAPAWLLGSRRLNQSQIGLWMASYEYIFLRLHTQENTSSRERVEAIYYDSHYNVDITCTPAPRFKFIGHSHSFRWFTFFFLSGLFLSLCIYLKKKSNFSFSCLLLFIFPPPLFSSIFSLSLFLLSSQPSGQRLSFKVLILIWNLLQSAQRWTWNTGLWDPIRVCEHACLCSDGFLLQFRSKIINETPGRAVVKHIRWCIIHICALPLLSCLLDTLHCL